MISNKLVSPLGLSTQYSVLGIQSIRRVKIEDDRQWLFEYKHVITQITKAPAVGQPIRQYA